MRKVQYYVEGECEAKLLNELKGKCIKAGKVQVLNFVNKKIPNNIINRITTGTDIVVVVDTDVTAGIEMFKENIQRVKNKPQIGNLYCVFQVKNLEDELVRSCNIKEVLELTSSKSNKDYKRDFLKMSNLQAKLDANEFDINLMWRQIPEGVFSEFDNNYQYIKMK